MTKYQGQGGKQWSGSGRGAHQGERVGHHYRSVGQPSRPTAVEAPGNERAKRRRAARETKGSATAQS